MVLLKLLIFTLTCPKLIAHLDAKCPRGQRVSNSNGCEACHEGYFQPEENDSKSCKVCQKCDPKSMTIDEQCTKVTDAKCKCREGFVPWSGDTASCYCPKGSGLKEPYTCSKCEHGSFSTAFNAPCTKWKECKSSEIQVKGSDTTDAVCIEKKNSDVVTTAPTSNKITSLIKHLQTMRPQEGAQTQEMNQVTTTSTPTTTSTTPRTSSGTGSTPNQPSNTGNPIVLALLLFGIVGLLILTAVTCRLHITPCMQRKPVVQANDPLCRRPVEESGDDSLYPLKLNPEKP